MIIIDEKCIYRISTNNYRIFNNITFNKIMANVMMCLETLFRNVKMSLLKKAKWLPGCKPKLHRLEISCKRLKRNTKIKANTINRWVMAILTTITIRVIRLPYSRHPYPLLEIHSLDDNWICWNSNNWLRSINNSFWIHRQPLQQMHPHPLRNSVFI